MNGHQWLSGTRKVFSVFRTLVIFLSIVCLTGSSLAASQIDIAGPVGSVAFGSTVTALPGGNIVVTDPTFNSSAGAVYLYNGTTGALISTLTGSSPSDSIGDAGIVVLANGNFVVLSRLWNGAAADVGAVTFGRGDTGVSGTVSAANSLVGSTTNDLFGTPSVSVTSLPNGNYVVVSPNWDGAATNVGAVTFCDGATGTVGPISISNSLVGSATNDKVGAPGITVLTNGNYVVPNPQWGSTDLGAVTFASGAVGISGTISASNSLVGSSPNDQVGSTTALPNGNYVVRSPGWDGAAPNVGAVTFANGKTGLTGTVTASNSLVGSIADDNVGSGITILTNSNFVVRSQLWDGTAVDSGAITWCSGTTGCPGTISSLNSVVGSVTNEFMSAPTALSNGNYVISTVHWSGNGVDAGAVRLCDGTGGCAGPLTSANSLVGSVANDFVGEAIFPLTNGNYVVTSPAWNAGPVADVGAATFVNGTTGLTGTISSSNSLVGSTLNDQVGLDSDWGVVPLANGNYVVQSHNWDSPIPNAGAVTFGNGTTGISGPITSSNSLIGSGDGDYLGNGSVLALTNGNYVVRDSNWDCGPANCGAVIFANGTTGITGESPSGSSLVGSQTNDGWGLGVKPLANGNYVVSMTRLGSVTFGNGTTGTAGTISAANSFLSCCVGTALPNGNYLVRNPGWDNGATADAGAASILPGNIPTVGTPSVSNSVIGTTTNGGPKLVVVYNYFNETMVVGLPASRKVIIFNPTYTSIADGNWSSATTWDYGAFDKPHDVVINSARNVTLDTNIAGGSVTIGSGGVLTLNADRSSAAPITNDGFIDLSLGKLDMGSSLLTIGCTGVITGSGPSRYLLGSTRKNFCSTGPYTFPVGTMNGYSPVNANITALAASPSSLTVRPVSSVHSTLDPTNSLKRFWMLTETGDLTTDLTFNYLDPQDISTDESSYKLYRTTGGVPSQVTPFTLNTGANTISTTAVSNFSDWAVGNTLATAAGVSISGRVLSSEGRGVRGTVVTMVSEKGLAINAITSPLGYYRFENVTPGQTYIINVRSRRFDFTPRVVEVMDNLTDIDLIGVPAATGRQEESSTDTISRQ